MNTYTIIKKPSHLDWDSIPSVSINYALHAEDVPISASAQVCYDNEMLYVRLSAKEPNIRAVYTELLDPPCEDSCLEFFFSPINGDIRYFNIELNPNCCMYLGIASGIDDLVRLIPEAGTPFSPKARYTSDGWEITYQIPFEFIRRFFPTFSPESGTTMRGNFFKCGERTNPEHYFSWNPISENIISFHRPCDFGLLIFE